MPDEQKEASEDSRSYALLDIDEVAPILSEISIFAGLSDAQLYKLFGLLRKTSYKAGERVFSEGDQPSHIYIVQSGSMKLVVNCDHAATAVCVEDTELIVLSRNALLSLYKSNLEMFSTLILNIAREACRRLAKTDEILLHYVVGK